MTESESRNVLIVGATSRIAIETARALISRGSCRFVLAGRNGERLESVSGDLVSRGAAAAHAYELDMADTDAHAGLIETAIAELGAIDVVLIAHGTLPDQRACESDVERTREELETNLVSTISLLIPLATYLENQGSGVLAVITSVAGDRGRQSNYLYGASKAGVSTYLQGLRNRLHGAGVRVITIKPGMVDTPMTRHLPKGPMFANPVRVGERIARAIDGSRDVVYVPGYWRWVMTVIRVIPEALFKRLEL